MQSPMPQQTPYYQIVLIRVKDAPKFSRYLELMAPIVQRYGGSLERRLLPDAIHSDGVPMPDAINVVFYDSRDAFSAFNQDPDFQEIVHLRSESIEMIAIGGQAIGGESLEGDLAERRYIVEFARFGPGGPAGYRSYEAQAEPMMRPYGYRVERVLAPDAAIGLPFVPDIAKVAYFDAHDGMERLEGDPAHGRIEKELYPSAVAESLWITGKVDPVTIGPRPTPSDRSARAAGGR